VPCHLADGAAFLRAATRRYDAIVLDAYADEAIPRHLVKRAFFTLVEKRLKRGGVFLANLIVADDDDRSADRICYRLATIFKGVRLLDADGFENRNAIAVAGATRRLKPPRLMIRPKLAARQIAASLRALDFRPLRP
jgi:spermidine synthase